MSNISTLDDHIDDLAGTDATSFTDAQKHAAMTRWAHILIAEIIETQDDWDFQGEISVASLVANQREYIFPSNILKIKRIDLKINDGSWARASILDESEVGHPLSLESDITENFTNSRPYVYLMDKSFFILSGTIIDVASGIKIWYSEEIVGEDTSGDDIASFTADTDKPKMIEVGQLGLVCGATLDYADKYEKEKLARRMNMRLYGNAGGRPADPSQIGGIVKQLRTFYSRRVQDKIMTLKSAYSSEDFE